MITQTLAFQVINFYQVRINLTWSRCGKLNISNNNNSGLFYSAHVCQIWRSLTPSAPQFLFADIMAL